MSVGPVLSWRSVPGRSVVVVKHRPARARSQGISVGTCQTHVWRRRVVVVANRFPIRIDFRCSERMQNWLTAAAAEADSSESQLIRDAVLSMLQDRYAHLAPHTPSD